MVTSSASTPVVTSPVFRNRDPIGVIVVLPLGSPVHTRSDRSDRTADCGKSGNPSDGRYVFDDIITASPLMADAIALGQRVATGALPVLVTGESGTGKEMIAQSIHSASERSGGPFVAVNCGSITEGLVDAEFCGYEESAFTGSSSRR
jgi:transcriptional regulator with PAS, ATPase and Fis domain